MGRSKWSSRVFHAPQPDHRTRDVFPLPQLQVEPLVKRGVCRAVARRVHVRAATAARANRVIAALNSIFSGRRIGLDVSCVRCLEDLPQNQQEAIRGILRAVRQLDKPPMHVTGLEALKALRAACDG